ncbi:M23 family metallopeptidase [Thermomonas alba]|uniref:M23 family metallopeptidase n=1 Tax=Thermomonas alba TaxID=2888525 RepID=UPI001F041DDC|nr:M23 family metallopeptidase [Thermomonas alba]
MPSLPHALRPLLAASLLALLPSALPAADPAAPAAGSPPALASLRVEPNGSEYLVWADNHLAGPIEVRVSATGSPPAWSQPPLPARASVAAGGSTLLAHLRMPPGSGLLTLRLEATPGSSNARPRDVIYRLPLADPHARIDQGFEGDFSHQDPENRYAIDFATPEGTPVLAARGGVVMQVQDGFRGHGLDPHRDASRANLIRILHDDGSMGLYAHLANGGAWVRVGQRVDAGQPIGLSGNTGYSTAPHLHFAVQVNRGMQLLSIPFRLTAPDGILDTSR